MEGVERQRDGRYRVRAEYRDPRTGRRREIDRLVHATSEADAFTIRARLLAERLAAVGETRPERVRLGDAMRAWRKAKALAPSTAERYDTAIDRWVGELEPHVDRAPFEDWYLDAVRAEDVSAVLAGWKDAELGTETINGRLRVLRTFAKDTRNAAIVEGVRALRKSVEEVEEDEDEGRGLDVGELRRLLRAGPTAKRRKDGTIPKPWPRAWALVCTLAWTGLRFGEASALRWDDVDLEACTLRVRRAQWRGIVGHPKAKSSKRTVPIDQLAPTLREHRDRMLREQLPGVGSALVFPSRIRGAEIVSNGYARDAMLAACEAAGIALSGRPALHCLRHSLNNLVRQHASEAVRRSLLGHADEVETYTHVEMQERRAAMLRVVREIEGI